MFTQTYYKQNKKYDCKSNFGDCSLVIFVWCREELKKWLIMNENYYIDSIFDGFIAKC